MAVDWGEMRKGMAHFCQSSFREHGVDLQCVLVEKERRLILTGPAVNWVFAHHFMQDRHALSAFKGSGFQSVSFENDGTNYLEDFSLDH